MKKPMNMILNCALVDNDTHTLDELEDCVSKTPFLKLVGRYESAVTALRGLQEHPADVLYLAVELPELSGLEFSKLINHNTRSVFISASGQHAVEAFRMNALDYLLKPVVYKDFLDSANRALQWFELKNESRLLSNCRSKGFDYENDFVYIKSEYKLVQVKYSDILYIEGLKDYVKIHLASQSRPIISLMSMKAVESHLPSSHFMRVHRSYIVARSKISEIERGKIAFGKTFLPVSDSYKEDLQRYLGEHTL